jgi:uncharacterized protein
MRYPREDRMPWYKQFWPWFVITPPFMGIVLGVLLVTAATHDPDGLVVGDYYKEGRGMNQRIERAQFAISLGLSATAVIEGDRIWLDLKSEVPIPRQEMQIAFVHPTRDHLDHRMPMAYDAGRDLYYAELNPLESALWHLHLEPNDGTWRLRGRLEAIDDSEVLLQPSA